MKVYTQEDFDNFPITGGIKQCPSGDYRNIKEFKDRCCFKDLCIFGDACTFRKSCTFGSYCSFGGVCSFMGRSRFSNGCIFGYSCFFVDCCIFEERCSFSDECKYYNGCTFEGTHKAKQGYPLLSFRGFGSVNRTTYFFNCVDGIFVRCGCFSGYIDDFRKIVKKTHKGHLRKEYLAIARIAENKFHNKKSFISLLLGH